MTNPETTTVVTLGGLDVTRVGETILIPLPQALWVPVTGGCACRYCSPERKQTVPAFWDALAASATVRPGVDRTWTVHAPELHGAKPKRETDR